MNGDLDIWIDATPRERRAGDARARGVRRPFGDVEVDFIGRAAFIRNKRAIGRAKDLADIEGLE